MTEPLRSGRRFISDSVTRAALPRHSSCATLASVPHSVCRGRKPVFSGRARLHFGERERARTLSRRSFPLSSSFITLCLETCSRLNFSIERERREREKETSRPAFFVSWGRARVERSWRSRSACSASRACEEVGVSRPQGALLVGWRGSRSRGPRLGPRRFRATAQQLERLVSVFVRPPAAVRGLTTQISTAATKFHMTMGVTQRESIQHFARIPRRPKCSSTLGLRASRAVRIVLSGEQ